MKYIALLTILVCSQAIANSATGFKSETGFSKPYVPPSERADYVPAYRTPDERAADSSALRSELRRPDSRQLRNGIILQNRAVKIQRAEKRRQDHDDFYDKLIKDILDGDS